MADRIPLIVNPSASQIQELPVGDSLTGINTVFATNFSGDLSGNVISTAGTFTTLNATTANLVTGIVTSISGSNLSYAGVSSFTSGPVLIGGGTSTGTALQRLQVTGGAYITGSVGMGTTNPSVPLHIQKPLSGELALFETTTASSPYFSFSSELTRFGYVGSASGFVTTGTRFDLGLRSDNNLIFSIGNAEKSRIDSLGNVLINSTTPTGTASQPLQVTGGAYVSGDVGIGITTPAFKLQVLGSFGATTKAFIIDHPTKKGKKLQYGSLEGPELGVYVRGRTQGALIELPEYWTKLVDAESITVSLTPIGNSAAPRVEKVSDNVVYVFTKEQGEMDYYYTVFAERCDVDKLQVEI